MFILENICCVNAIYQDNLPATEFITELNNTKKSYSFSNNNNFTTAMNSSNPITKDIGLLFYKNYKYIYDDYENRKNRCNYLNYWLDVKEEEHKKVFGDKHNHEWECIKTLRNNIETGRFQLKLCNDIRNEHSLIERGNHYELEHFCENRDYLRKLCIQQENSISAGNSNCSNLSNYINKNYKYFFEKYRCLKGDKNKNEFQYHVTSDCTLYNMNKTFPEYTFDNKQILEKENSRNNIILCSEFDKVISCHNKVDKTAPIAITTPERQCNCHSTQNILYGVLALLGILSTFFFLYNFTSLGSWLRGRMTRNQIAPGDVDEHEGYTLSDDPSDILDMNSENKAYYLAYKPG
ncbi:PIR protein [Plasmodium ovale]|uniref:PIR protein n=1 Tax=Plasmodium ovale TaxID=36330 RepID=A0A1C3KXY6_PLAOA|nr:PIR protein [Plasmodium ovale]